MTKLLTPPDVLTFFDNAGKPLAYGKVFTYAAGTAFVTPAATFSDRAGSAANTNPIILNIRGEATIYLTAGQVYDWLITDPGNVPIRTRLGVDAFANSVTADTAQTLTGPKLFDTGSGYTEFRRDTAPLNYVGTRAALVVQNRDAGNGGVNDQIPGVVFQFTSTGNGIVNAATELSQSIWWGLQLSQTKTGDGSGHCATAVGELGAYGPGLYNELGLFQGTGTNKGSLLGTISGVEMLLQDSPNGGTTSYSTKMQPIVSRIAKYNATARKSHSFFASSEGALPPDAILGGNTAGLASWKRGIDFSGLSFTTGEAALLPNNTSLAWYRAGGAAVSCMFLSSADNFLIPLPTTSSKVAITTSAPTFADRFAVDNDATNAVLVWVGGVLKRAQQGAPDSGGVGKRNLIVDN